MDPQLFDLLWQVYQQSGSRDYIHVVCGYRSPDTNGTLRRRSRGVAKNSLHMQGKAMDFFIPGVALPKLRAIGLRMQTGGVGFYPTSGSPFVHMDTGSVRHVAAHDAPAARQRLPERPHAARSLRRQAAARLRRGACRTTRRARPAVVPWPRSQWLRPRSRQSMQRRSSSLLSIRTRPMMTP